MNRAPSTHARLWAALAAIVLSIVFATAPAKAQRRASGRRGGIHRGGFRHGGVHRGGSRRRSGFRRGLSRTPRRAVRPGFGRSGTRRSAGIRRNTRSRSAGARTGLNRHGGRRHGLGSTFNRHQRGTRIRRNRHATGPGLLGGFGSIGGIRHGRAGTSGLLNHTGELRLHGLNRLHASSHGLLQHRLRHHRQTHDRHAIGHHLSFGLHGGPGLHGIGNHHIGVPFLGGLIVSPPYSSGTFLYDDLFDTYPADRIEAAPTEVEYTPGEALRLGRQFMKQQAYDRAVEALMAAVLAEPDAGLPKLLLGHALFAAGDYAYAAYAVRRAMDRIDDLGAVTPAVADLYSDAKELDRLLYRLHKNVDTHPIEADGYFLLGYFSLYSGDHKAAADALDRALRRAPGDRHAARLRDRLPAQHPQETPQPRVQPKIVYPPAAKQ